MTVVVPTFVTGRYEVALIHHGMPVQEIARFEGLNKILECRKTNMRLVVIIVYATRR